MSRRNFTWANNLTVPTYEKLSVNVDGVETKISVVHGVFFVNRDICDHIHLLLNTNFTDRKSVV